MFLFVPLLLLFFCFFVLYVINVFYRGPYGSSSWSIWTNQVSVQALVIFQGGESVHGGGGGTLFPLLDPCPCNFVAARN